MRASVCRLEGGLEGLGRGLGLWGGRGVLRGVGSMNRVERSTIANGVCNGQRRGLLTISHAKGDFSPPLLPHTIPEHFSSIVSQHGDKMALISKSQGEKGRLTFRELDERSNIVAEGLRRAGVRKDEKVCVMLGNSWEFGVITYAVWKLGGVLVPLNPAFNSTQVIAALSHLNAEHLIIGTETNLPYKPPRENISLLKQIIPDIESGKVESTLVPSLRNVILVNNSKGRIRTESLKSTTPFDDLIKGFTSTKEKEIIPDEPLHRDDIINIQFTSGTTSTPKAACLTHHSILNNGYFIGSRMGLHPTDIICCPPPLFHCFGSILGYMATATHGSCILFPSESFNAYKTLKSIAEEKATGLYGVATMFVAELELLSQKLFPMSSFSHLRTGIAAGSSVPSHLMEKLHSKLNLTGLIICYGMTETSPVSFMTTPDDPLEKRVDSVGRLLPHVEAKIVSVTDPSLTLPLGEKGELVVSGYNVMKHYFNDPIRTSEVRVVETHTNPHTRVKDEKVWMFTGDEAMMDNEGYVRITGRIKDLIIRGGENIHPLEVENCLFAMREVSEVSVVGVPDERYGEVVGAFVVAHKGVRVGVDDSGAGDVGIDEMAEECEEGMFLTRNMVREWVRKELSNHLVPRYVFWIDEYPKTASGKIQKFKLRELGVRLLEEAEVKKGSEKKMAEEKGDVGS